ncbi:DNA-binding CsgD family transcriptional regulator/tetratricopeptide (TPR) repeat protein [Actinoplanes lutulentus]|uniref:Regulatory LuxR family protein n=1 Tax=Actinoplanes lutulentus TaxID=1287878 RepID=A0A327ZNU8_9ACTN|nr:LuxR family transcriptional regulator [Actinoplanes lutulentus]MBB2940703.1 DNA-binding CsgD family transcriptional regulator/tetratricopeptide (TPR) repeat protein [Actinoplanes lutulentus]RAK43014.1 regulatory LuxR family protein [Actinoplanes lutulentus]
MTQAARLFGRAEEIRRVGVLIADLPEQGAALILRGDAGIGKSAILAQAVADARQAGVRVLSTTGVEAESHLNFAGLHQLLAPVLRHAGELPDPQRTAILTAFGLADAPPPDLFLIALASLNLLADSGPLLVAVDDAHWLDPASAAVLTFIARRIAAEPIALILSARDGFGTSFDDQGIPSLCLEALDPGAAETMLDARAPDLSPAARATILAAAQGNPLALTELPSVADRLDPARSWLPLTTRLERAFAGRLDDLPQATVTVLGVAALNDGDALAEALAAASLVEHRPVTAGELQPAVLAGLVSVDEGRVRFRHPLVRSAIHLRISGLDRLAVHGALAEVLDGRAERRLWHRAAASHGPDEAIARDLDAAAQRARGRGAVAGAVRTLELAARLSTDQVHRVERLLQAASLSTEIGRREEVDRLLDLIGPAEMNPAQRAKTAWVRGRFDHHLADSTTGVRALIAYARDAITRGETDLALDLLYAVGLACAFSEPGAELRGSAVSTARQVAVEDDDPRLLLVLAFADPVECGAEVSARLHTWTDTAADDGSLYRVLATAANAIGEYQLCLAFVAPALVRLRAQGRLGLLTRALAVQVRAAANMANLGIAVPAVEEMIRLACETSVPPVEALGWAQNAHIAALRGRYDEFEENAAQAERLGAPVRASAALATAQHARGLAGLATGRYREATDHLLRIFAPQDPAYHLLSCWDAIGDLAEAGHRGDDQDRVRDVVAGMERIAERMPTTALRVNLGYARAMLSPGQHLVPFLATDLTAWPFLRARAQLVYGERLRRHRRRAESRTALRAARDTFDAIGTIPWGDRARQELRAAGETSGHRAPDAMDRLTPQELQIAHLAAEGLTNREIGQRLYVSHRTVSTHLHRIFPKLGVTSRAAVKDAMGRFDAPDRFTES